MSLKCETCHKELLWTEHFVLDYRTFCYEHFREAVNKVSRIGQYNSQDNTITFDIMSKKG